MLFKRIGGHTLPLPSQATPYSAGYDLRTSEDLYIPPQEYVVVQCGFAVAVPPGWVGQIWSRSGLGVKRITTRAGIIDSDYRGELLVILVNESESAWEATLGERIAQLVITPCAHSIPEERDELPRTDRGEGGFGSTGSH